MIDEDQDKIIYAQYKELLKKAKKEMLKVVKVRKNKIMDVLTDKSWLEITVGACDFDNKTDKEVYRFCIIASQKYTPKFYTYIENEVKDLSSIY